jgi:hypothetical protein
MLWDMIVLIFERRASATFTHVAVIVRWRIGAVGVSARCLARLDFAKETRTRERTDPSAGLVLPITPTSPKTVLPIGWVVANLVLMTTKRGLATSLLALSIVLSVIGTVQRNAARSATQATSKEFEALQKTTAAVANPVRT